MITSNNLQRLAQRGQARQGSRLASRAPVRGVDGRERRCGHCGMARPG